MALNMQRLKGVNLGSWLLMEGYILGGRNIAESEFKDNFKKVNGGGALKKFEYLFRDNFIKEDDFKNIAAMGANTIRVPFNYHLIEKKPCCYAEESFFYLKQALAWANKHKLGIILDLHAAPGAQNYDWHSDCRDRALFWEKEEYQERACLIWEQIIAQCKDMPALIGYDIINEPVIGKRSTGAVKRFYVKAIKRIRALDKKHIIFLEGDIWAQRIDYLKDLLGDNVCISIHTYQPLNYTFNFVPFYTFPGKIDNVLWNEKQIFKYLEPYYKFSKNNKTRIFVGEFGINWRGGFWGEIAWLTSILRAFEAFSFDYTYWTYKAIAGHIFPDGIYQYILNPDYVKREGPIFGWENYIKYWKTDKQKIVEFWQTNNFTPNKEIIETLSKFYIK